MIVDLPIESYGFLQSLLYVMRPKKNRVEFDWKNGRDRSVFARMPCVWNHVFWGNGIGLFWKLDGSRRMLSALVEGGRA